MENPDVFFAPINFEIRGLEGPISPEFMWACFERAIEQVYEQHAEDFDGPVLFYWEVPGCEL